MALADRSSLAAAERLITALDEVSLVAHQRAMGAEAQRTAGAAFPHPSPDRPTTPDPGTAPAPRSPAAIAARGATARHGVGL
ncbi:MAG: hypothetical protein ACRCYX_10640 [Dermatophilaceae bacterium]